MTRKDYVLIAATLRRIASEIPTERSMSAADYHEQVCAALADRLRMENPNFDHARFMRAAMPAE